MDDILKQIAIKAKSQGVHIEKTELSREWLRYLAMRAREAEVMDEDLEHLSAIYEKLMSRDYLDGNVRKATHPLVVERLVAWVEALDMERLESGIAAVFVFHQLAEEWLARFLSIQRFIVDLKLGSYRITHRPVEKMGFAALCSEIDLGVDVPSREELAGQARLLNSTRNRIAHDLLSNPSIEEMKSKCEQFIEEFSQFENTFNNAFEEAAEIVKSFSKWSDMFEDDYESSLLQVLDEGAVAYLSKEDFGRREGLLLE